MDRIELENLLQKYNQGKCSPLEKDFVEAWYLQFKNQEAEELDMEIALRDLDGVWNHLETSIIGHARPVKRVSLWPQTAVAAAVIFLLFGAILFYFYNHKNNKSGIPVYAYDVAPGKNSATLILSNGKRIKLEDIKIGEFIDEGGIIVSKTADHQIIYDIKESDDHLSQTNTLVTASGETYQMKLPDGSLVWLNSATSITYPISFKNSKSRQVKLSGEAYFEIAKDKLHPFLVESDDQQVKVLGTHFNINAYPDEPFTKTILAEGSVSVLVKSGTVPSFLLKPDEQLIGRKTFRVSHVDAAAEISWIKGKFFFNEETLESILRKVSRWYNVQVEFKDQEAKNEVFGGTMSRFDKVSKVLAKLEATGDVRFEIIRSGHNDYKVLVYKK